MNFYQGIIEKCVYYSGLAISSLCSSFTTLKRLHLSFLLVGTEVIVFVVFRSALGCTVDAFMLEHVLFSRTYLTLVFVSL